MRSLESFDKRAIAAAFSRAALSYDSAAALQRRAGERLMQLGCEHPGLQVLDAGCGTGHFSSRWQALGKRVTALDLSEGMLAQARLRQRANHYLLGDIERIALPDASVDLCFSNLALQWCDLSNALRELLRVTRPGGLVLFSTLMMGSLAELASAWQRVDGRSHVNHFLTCEQIGEACRDYRLYQETEVQTLHFPDVITLMRSLKGIGATHLHQGRSTTLLGRRRLLALQAAYMHQMQGYPLSYHLFYGAIQRE